MSDELVGQHEYFLQGHAKGYQEALEDVLKQVNAIPASYNTISIELVNGLIKKLQGKK